MHLLGISAIKAKGYVYCLYFLEVSVLAPAINRALRQMGALMLLRKAYFFFSFCLLEIHICLGADEKGLYFYVVIAPEL